MHSLLSFPFLSTVNCRQEICIKICRNFIVHDDISENGVSIMNIEHVMSWKQVHTKIDHFYNNCVMVIYSRNKSKYREKRGQIEIQRWLDRQREREWDREIASDRERWRTNWDKRQRRQNEWENTITLSRL